MYVVRYKNILQHNLKHTFKQHSLGQKNASIQNIAKEINFCKTTHTFEHNFFKNWAYVA